MVQIVRLCLVFCLLWRVAVGQTSEELRLAMSGGFQPFSTTDHQGNLVGLDADMAREIAKKMGRKARLIQVDWSGIQAGLQAGKYDLICGSMAITAERQRAMTFSLPYYVSGAQLFARRESPSRVGVTESSTYEDYLHRHFPQLSVLRFGSEAEIVTALSTGKVDGFVSDRIVGQFYLNRGRVEGIEPHGPLLYREVCGIAAAAGRDELIAQVNLALLACIQDGSYTRHYRHWVGQDPDLAQLLQSWGDFPLHPPEAGDQQVPKSRFARSPTDMLGVLAQGATLTLVLSILAGSLSLVTGTAVAVTLVLAPFPWRSLARGYILLVRGTPLLVQLFLCYFGWATLVNRSLGQEVMGPMGAALMALVINTTAYHAESIRGALLSIDVGQWEAAASLGLTTGQSLRRILLPQALSRALSSLGNNSIVLIKDTSLVGAITLVELSYSARNLVFQSGQAFLPFALAGGLYLIIIAACSAGFQWLERRRPEARA